MIDNKALYGYDVEASLATIYSPVLATNKEDIFSLKFSQFVDRVLSWHLTGQIQERKQLVTQ